MLSAPRTSPDFSQIVDKVPGTARSRRCKLPWRTIRWFEDPILGQVRFNIIIAHGGIPVLDSLSPELEDQKKTLKLCSVFVKRGPLAKDTEESIRYPSTSRHGADRTVETGHP